MWPFQMIFDRAPRAAYLQRHFEIFSKKLISTKEKKKEKEKTRYNEITVSMTIRLLTIQRAYPEIPFPITTISSLSIFPFSIYAIRPFRRWFLLVFSLSPPPPPPLPSIVITARPRAVESIMIDLATKKQQRRLIEPGNVGRPAPHEGARERKKRRRRRK